MKAKYSFLWQIYNNYSNLPQNVQTAFLDISMVSVIGKIIEKYPLKNKTAFLAAKEFLDKDSVSKSSIRKYQQEYGDNAFNQALHDCKEDLDELYKQGEPLAYVLYVSSLMSEDKNRATLVLEKYYCEFDRQIEKKEKTDENTVPGAQAWAQTILSVNASQGTHFRIEDEIPKYYQNPDLAKEPLFKFTPDMLGFGIASLVCFIVSLFLM